MNMTLLQLGKTKQDFWQMAENEYAKRLKAYAKLNILTLKEEKIRQDTPQEKARVVEKEGEKILEFLNSRSASSAPAGSFVVALDSGGKTLDSPGLAKKLTELQHEGRSITLVIGGCYGLAAGVKARADLVLSLSPMTFTHEMARTVLLEQLYRAFTIATGHPYHY